MAKEKLDLSLDDLIKTGDNNEPFKQYAKKTGPSKQKNVAAKPAATFSVQNHARKTRRVSGLDLSLDDYSKSIGQERKWEYNFILSKGAVGRGRQNPVSIKPNAFKRFREGENMYTSIGNGRFNPQTGRGFIVPPPFGVRQRQDHAGLSNRQFPRVMGRHFPRGGTLQNAKFLQPKMQHAYVYRNGPKYGKTLSARQDEYEEEGELGYDAESADGRYYEGAEDEASINMMRPTKLRRRLINGGGVREPCRVVLCGEGERIVSDVSDVEEGQDFLGPRIKRDPASSTMRSVNVLTRVRGDNIDEDDVNDEVSINREIGPLRPKLPSYSKNTYGNDRGGNDFNSRYNEKVNIRERVSTSNDYEDDDEDTEEFYRNDFQREQRRQTNNYERRDQNRSYQDDGYEIDNDTPVNNRKGIVISNYSTSVTTRKNRSNNISDDNCRQNDSNYGNNYENNSHLSSRVNNNFVKNKATINSNHPRKNNTETENLKYSRRSPALQDHDRNLKNIQRTNRRDTETNSFADTHNRDEKVEKETNPTSTRITSQNEKDDEDYQRSRYTTETKRNRNTRDTKDSQTNSIIISNVPSDLNADEVEEAFSIIGKIRRARVVSAATSDSGSNTIVLTYENSRNAEEAVRRFDRGDLNSNIIRVALH